jgi:hypothetical protein
MSRRPAFVFGEKNRGPFGRSLSFRVLAQVSARRIMIFAPATLLGIDPSRSTWPQVEREKLLRSRASESRRHQARSKESRRCAGDEPAGLFRRRDVGLRKPHRILVGGFLGRCEFLGKFSPQALDESGRVSLHQVRVVAHRELEDVDRVLGTPGTP